MLGRALDQVVAHRGGGDRKQGDRHRDGSDLGRGVEAPGEHGLAVQQSEECVGGEKLPEKDAVGDLAQEADGTAAQQPGGKHPGRVAGQQGLERDRRDHRRGDEGVEHRLELGRPEPRDAGEFRPGERGARDGEGAGGDQAAHARRTCHRAAEAAGRGVGAVGAGYAVGPWLSGGPRQRDGRGHPGAEPDQQGRQRALGPQAGAGVVAEDLPADR